MATTAKIIYDGRSSAAKKFGTHFSYNVYSVLAVENMPVFLLTNGAATSLRGIWELCASMHTLPSFVSTGPEIRAQRQEPQRHQDHVDVDVNINIISTITPGRVFLSLSQFRLHRMKPVLLYSLLGDGLHPILHIPKYGFCLWVVRI